MSDSLERVGDGKLLVGTDDDLVRLPQTINRTANTTTPPILGILTLAALLVDPRELLKLHLEFIDTKPVMWEGEVASKVRARRSERGGKGAPENGKLRGDLLARRGEKEKDADDELDGWSDTTERQRVNACRR